MELTTAIRITSDACLRSGRSGNIAQFRFTPRHRIAMTPTTKSYHDRRRQGPPLPKRPDRGLPARLRAEPGGGSADVRHRGQGGMRQRGGAGVGLEAIDSLAEPEQR